MLRTKGWLVLTAALAIIASAAGRADAGLIVVSGDENITDALVGNGITVDPGNQRFFENVLGGGTHVLVQGTDLPATGDIPVANTNSLYNSLGGVTSTIQSGPVTAASLAGVNLFVSAIPANAFDASEVAALSAFSAGGGTIFLMGDAQAFAPTQDANLNALLTGLGSPLQIVPDNLDSGFMTATAVQIASTPLTAGVSTFTYAFVSQVSGGRSDFFTTGEQTFIADNGTAAAVPEPTTLVSAGIAGAMGLVFGWRRRMRAAA